MEQNKTGKYLKYAIGEIVFVVIGVLIAIQRNNLNENKKEHEKEYRSNLIQLEEKISDEMSRLKST